MRKRLSLDTKTLGEMLQERGYSYGLKICATITYQLQRKEYFCKEQLGLHHSTSDFIYHQQLWDRLT